MAKLRIEGLPEEVAEMLDYLRTVLDITDESKVYPNRPPSRKVRVFLDANAAPPHVGQWLDVDGEDVHILAAPDMSQKTADALREVVRLVRKSTTQETITVRELCTRIKPNQDIEARGWLIEVIDKTYPVIAIIPLKNDEYHIFYRSPSDRQAQRSYFANGDTVLTRGTT